MKHQLLVFTFGFACLRESIGTWVENPVPIIVIKEHRVVIKHVLYDQYILESFLGFSWSL